MGLGRFHLPRLAKCPSWSIPLLSAAYLLRKTPHTAKMEGLRDNGNVACKFMFETRSTKRSLGIQLRLMQSICFYSTSDGHLLQECERALLTMEYQTHVFHTLAPICPHLDVGTFLCRTNAKSTDMKGMEQPVPLEFCIRFLR